MAAIQSMTMWKFTMLVAERRSHPTPYAFVPTVLRDNYQLCGTHYMMYVWWCDVVKLSSKKNKKEESKNNFNNNKGGKKKKEKHHGGVSNEVLGNLYLALFVD